MKILFLLITFWTNISTEIRQRIFHSSRNPFFRDLNLPNTIHSPKVNGLFRQYIYMIYLRFPMRDFYFELYLSGMVYFFYGFEKISPAISNGKHFRVVARNLSDAHKNHSTQNPIPIKFYATF